jgi:D-alanyl-D-alanine carboxypeptidase/D-alanyl-D-alanine-endopeptidase (penicillin-binding protein 4)
MLLLNSCAAHKIEKELGKQGEKNDYFRGLVVYNTKTGKEIINYNGNKYFTPASNTKLFTFYTAYKTFRDSVTGLQYTRKRDSLIIKGTADPTFLYGFEESKTLDFLKNTGSNIYLVDENIAENSFGPGWAWDDYTYYYMPEKSLFPIYGNIVKIDKTKDSIKIVPSLFKDDIVADPDADKRRDYDKNIFYVKPQDEFKDRSVPFKTSNQLLADLLGEEIGKKIVLITPKEDYKFWDLKSVRYDSVYKEMLYVSDNFIAEQLMLQVGNAVDSTYSVSHAIDYSLKNYLKGIPQKPRWVDGSGLSRYNLFTPESLVFLLKKMYKEIPHEKLFDYLPVGGQSGTLKNYYRNERPYIHAKSGTLSNNYNLSGYLITKKGTVLIFSFMNNHYQGSSTERKKEMEKVFLKLYNSY